MRRVVIRSLPSDITTTDRSKVFLTTKSTPCSLSSSADFPCQEKNVAIFSYRALAGEVRLLKDENIDFESSKFVVNDGSLSDVMSVTYDIVHTYKLNL